MKGVSEIIAIILILMIVIALAALAYTWFSGVFAQLTGQTSTAVTQTANEMTTQFKTEAARFTAYGASPNCCTNVTIRNIGSQPINGSQAAVYIGSVAANYQGICNSTACGTSLLIPQYGTAVIYNVSNSTAGYFSGPVCTNPTTIMVSIGAGITDSRTISC